MYNNNNYVNQVGKYIYFYLSITIIICICIEIQQQTNINGKKISIIHNLLKKYSKSEMIFHYFLLWLLFMTTKWLFS